jgi:uncharacterized protein
MDSEYIDVSELLDHPDTELEVSGDVRLESTKLGIEKIDFNEPFDFSVKLTNAGDGIVIKGLTNGCVVLRCSRCLKHFTYKASVDLDEVAVFDPEAAEEGGFVVEGSRLDMAPIVYQNVVVDIPMRPLHSEDCAGLCQVCGKDLNEEPHEHKEELIDERLSALKDFFKKDDEDEK